MEDNARAPTDYISSKKINSDDSDNESISDTVTEEEPVTKSEKNLNYEDSGDSPSVLNTRNIIEKGRGIKRERADEKEAVKDEIPKYLSPKVQTSESPPKVQRTQSPVKAVKRGISSSIDHLMNNDDIYDMI